MTPTPASDATQPGQPVTTGMDEQSTMPPGSPQTPDAGTQPGAQGQPGPTQGESATQMQAGREGAGTDANAQVAVMTDEEAAAVVDAINTGEIEMARLAKTRAANNRVREFATMMIRDHSEAKKKQEQITQRMGMRAKSNDLSKRLEEDGNRTLATLRTLKGKDFDDAYMDAQVRAHSEALNVLQNQVIPSVRNKELRTHFEVIKPKVEAHLTHARELQGKISQGQT